MEKNLIIMFVTIVVYMLMMVVIGLVCSKKNEDVSDFYLGGRKLGPFGHTVKFGLATLHPVAIAAERP